MDTQVDPTGIAPSSIAGLIAKAHKSDFGEAALAFLSGVARIESFGSYYISDIARPVPALSFWSGRISDYWFQRDAAIILGKADVQQQIITQIQSLEQDRVHFDRWHPGPDDPRQAMYVRNGIIERVAVSSRDGRSGLRSFYLRSAADGWFTEDEYAQLCEMLPIVHRLIALRQQIVGTAGPRTRTGSNATRLRDCNVAGFADLSPRETEVCDLLLDGKSVAATALDLSVSEATIRTLRQRAFRKLNVGSGTELFGPVCEREEHTLVLRNDVIHMDDRFTSRIQLPSAAQAISSQQFREFDMSQTTAVSLQEKIDAHGDIWSMLYNAPSHRFQFPVKPEYSNWVDEQKAWRSSVIFQDMSHHMTDVFFEGPDVVRLLSDLGINSFEGFGPMQAKQYVACNYDGQIIGDAILFCEEENKVSIVGNR